MEKTEKPKSWQERRKDIKHKWLTPFVYIEWLCEQTSYRLGRWALLDVLGHIGRLTILLAVISYFMGAEGRRKVSHYQAWQVINAAQGKPGSGGRVDALQDLNNDKVSLCGVDVSKAYLPEIDLKDVDLSRANLSDAYCKGANLSGATLVGANLSGAYFEDANLSGATFVGANLSGAYFEDANLSGANLRASNLSKADLRDATLPGAFLRYANLSRANLSDADFSKANLSDANLSGANLSDVNFSLATLSGANLSDAYFEGANLFGAFLLGANLLDIRRWKDVNSIEFAIIYGVKNEPNGFIEWAKEHGAMNIKSRNELQALLKDIKSRDEWLALLNEKRRKKK